MDRALKAEAELTRLRAERDSMEIERTALLNELTAVLSEKPIKGSNEVYIHLPYCNGDRHVLPGTVGKTCCCLPSKRSAISRSTALLIDLRALVDQWQNEYAAKTLFHATMGLGWKACADELAARLAREPHP